MSTTSPKQFKPKVYRLMGEALRDFGYEISDEEVKAEADNVLATGQADNVIQMFIKGWLEDMGLCPE